MNNLDQLRDLPLDCQDFRELREQNLVYVDKTEPICKMVKKNKYYFLARPRRFGKSLLVSTLEALFRGEESDKKLFEGLYIYNHWDWNESYNVIRIDFTKISTLTPEKLEYSLALRLDEIAENNAITLTAKFASNKFSQLIEKFYKSNYKKVVVLIDEYDKPILDRLKAMKETDISIANREILREFYQVLKGSGEYLRFVFLTGITEFDGLSVFSGLNNCIDLTLDENFADICGYTQKELIDNFSDRIEIFTKKLNGDVNRTLERIKRWYNGYTWDGKTAIYNPYSIIRLFNYYQFDTYWYRTGTPNFFIDYIKNNAASDLFFDRETVDTEMLLTFNPHQTSPIALLFQTGYLTIKEKIVAGDNYDKKRHNGIDEIEMNEDVDFGVKYIIASPNYEVKCCLSKHILLTYMSNEEMQNIMSFREYFIEGVTKLDANIFASVCSRLMAPIASNNHLALEKFYHSILLAAMNVMGFDVIGERQGGLGNSDIVWTYGDNVIIIEIKFIDMKAESQVNKKVNEALKQIKEKRYYEVYEKKGKKIILAGLAFTRQAKITKAKFEVWK
jgi:hypothetical protein